MQLGVPTSAQAWHMLITPEMRQGYAYGIYRKLFSFLPQRIAKQPANEAKLKEMASIIECQIFSGSKSQSSYMTSFTIQGNALIEITNTIYGKDFFNSFPR